METQQQYQSGETSGLVEWQKDELVEACISCNSKFTFWSRRHHCRCCGSIFCSSCSSHFAYYDKRKVKVLQRSEGVVEAQPYRTCNSCHETLLQRGLLLTKQGKVLPSGSGGGPSNSSPQDSTSFTSFRNNLVKGDTVREAEVERSDSSNASGSQAGSSTTPEEYSKCPICNEDLANFSEGESALHVQTCLEQASNIQQHHLKYKPGMSGFKNRILVYLMPDNTRGDGDLTECPICFEDMEPGQKIGRLECLCVFHYDCIKSWLKKKSEKMSSTGCAVDATKNFCPLHDAIF